MGNSTENYNCSPGWHHLRKKWRERKKKAEEAFLEITPSETHKQGGWAGSRNDQEGEGNASSRERAQLSKAAEESVNKAATGFGNWIICQYVYHSLNLMHINHN